MKAAILCVARLGCATKEPLMTPEQEAQFREACVQGCEVVPSPIWNQIMQMLQAMKKWQAI